MTPSNWVLIVSRETPRVDAKPSTVLPSAMPSATRASAGVRSNRTATISGAGRARSPIAVNTTIDSPPAKMSKARPEAAPHVRSSDHASRRRGRESRRPGRMISRRGRSEPHQEGCWPRVGEDEALMSPDRGADQGFAASVHGLDEARALSTAGRDADGLQSIRRGCARSCRRRADSRAARARCGRSRSSRSTTGRVTGPAASGRSTEKAIWLPSGSEMAVAVAQPRWRGRKNPGRPARSRFHPPNRRRGRRESPHALAEQAGLPVRPLRPALLDVIRHDGCEDRTGDGLVEAIRMVNIIAPWPSPMVLRSAQDRRPKVGQDRRFVDPVHEVEFGAHRGSVLVHNVLSMDVRRPVPTRRTAPR